MKSGTGPTRTDRRDYDLLATRKHKLAGITTIPTSYSVDAGLRIPDQNAEDDSFTPPVPALPYGCTDYAQCEIMGDEDGRLYNPMELENITHASARGGANIREALNAVKKLYPNHPAYFAIRPSGPVDAFDAVQLAMLIASTEKRGVSVGSPYWLQWGAVGPSGILPPPDYDLEHASWHNWVIKGWKVINGTTYLTCQMLQGKGYGRGGFAYLTREVFNATMAIPGAAMFTLDKLLPGEEVQTVGSPYVQAIVNFILSLFGR